MKYMLGLIDLNPFEILGDALFSQRYMSQVFLPLLYMLETSSDLRVSITMTGSVLEYIAESYPKSLNRLLVLAEAGQIEIFCSTYTYADWPLFPSLDLRRSCQITAAICREKNIGLSRTLVSSYNAYWPAMRTFSNEFDVFLMRDTFLKGSQAARGFPEMARVDNVLICVAANNILHDIATTLVEEKYDGWLSSFHEERIGNAVETWPTSDPRFTDILLGSDQWHWFHAGGAHHLTTGGGPRNWDAFFFDPQWMRIVRRFYENRLQMGWKFALVSEFTTSAKVQIGNLPDLCGSGLEVPKSTGAYWAGGLEERLRAVSSWRSLSWRSRSALRQAEASLAEQIANMGESAEIHQQIDYLWRSQLWTEVSPATGRAVQSRELEFVREHSEKVLSAAVGLSFEHDILYQGIGLGQRAFNDFTACDAETSPVEVALINGEGSVKWFRNDDGLYRVEFRFTADEATCGVSFKLVDSEITFGSCGQDEEMMTASLEFFGEGQDVVNSPAGLYGLGAQIYVVRHNSIVSVSAQIGHRESELRFMVDYVNEGRQFEWPFTVVKGTASVAFAVANAVNAI